MQMVTTLLVVSWLGLMLVEGSKVPLTMLTQSKAKCLDGTQAGYYAQPAGNSADKNKWVIYLNGGGECDTESGCQYQTTGALGSSKYFASEVDASSWYLASDYCANNPTFCTWNHLYDPYCTQDLHSGQVTTPSNDTWGLYFAGHHVFTAMLDEMDNHFTNSLKDATDIILSGGSAGGIGVWMNVDYLAKRYPKAKVTALTIAGHYFYATFYDGVNHTDSSGIADFRETAWPTTYALYDAFVDESCKIAHELKGMHPGACMLSNNSFPYIESDAFVVQAQTDQVVLTGHDCWPETYMYEAPEQEFMSAWQANMTVALKPLMAIDSKTVKDEEVSRRKTPRNGVFAAACYTHGGFTHSYPLIQGYNFYQAFGNFYFESTSPELYKLSDDCGLMCNPTCNTSK